MGEAGNQRLGDRRRSGRREAAARHLEGWQSEEEPERLGRLVRGRAVRQTDRDRTVRGARPAPHLRAKLCRKNGGDLEQIKFLLGHSSIQTTERYLGSEQDIAVAVNDNLGL
jgi:integrase